MLERILLKTIQAKDTLTQNIFNGRCGPKCQRIMSKYRPVGVEFIPDEGHPWFEYKAVGTRKGMNRWLRSGGKIKAEKRLAKYLIASKQAYPFLRNSDNFFIL